MTKPIIGITIGGRPDDPDEGIRGYRSYAEAVEEAGGECRFLHPKSSEIEADLDGLNGLLLTGGLDIHPRFYDPADANMSDDELKDTYRMTCSPERDAYELPLTHTAYAGRLPILGICRGFQLLNVALGGSLVKDIRTGRKHWAIRKDEADEGAPGESRRHMVTMIADTKIARIVGDCPILVNSRHHQGVTQKEMSEKVKAAAYSPDGIVEAIESVEHPWATAVQWHPERKADDYVYDVCKALFAEFVEASKRT